MDGWLSVFSWIGLDRSSVWIFLLLLSKPVHLGQTNWCNNKQATIKGRGGGGGACNAYEKRIRCILALGAGRHFFLGNIMAFIRDRYGMGSDGVGGFCRLLCHTLCFLFFFGRSKKRVGKDGGGWLLYCLLLLLLIESLDAFNVFF